MPFPNLEGKQAGRPYVTARRLLDYHDSLGTAPVAVPRAMMLTWQPRLEQRVRERREHRELRGPGIGAGSLLRLTPDLGLARLPIGAPAAAIAVEELSARGTEVFIGVGTAGAIDERLAAGDLVVCSAALRDEGTSYHYASPGPLAVPDAGLTARLRAVLDDRRAVPGDRRGGRHVPRRRDRHRRDGGLLPVHGGERGRGASRG